MNLSLVVVLLTSNSYVLDLSINSKLSQIHQLSYVLVEHHHWHIRYYQVLVIDLHIMIVVYLSVYSMKY